MSKKKSNATSGPVIKVLIVDDNKTYRNAFRRNLMMQNYQVCEAEDADEALRVIKAEPTERVLPHLKTVAVLQSLHQTVEHRADLAQCCQPGHRKCGAAQLFGQRVVIVSRELHPPRCGLLHCSRKFEHEAEPVVTHCSPRLRLGLPA